MEEILGPLFKDKNGVGGDVFQFEYELGETGLGGGFVFYRSETPFGDGWHYLEAAPTDASLIGNTLGSSYMWSFPETPVDGGTGRNIGDGKNNTTKIMATSYVGHYAAESCVSYPHSTTDWFLPSIGELEKLYQWKDKNDISGFQSDYYWSSTENTSDLESIETINFQNGTQSTLKKCPSEMCYVRPIRAF